ncbi:unnamed protein product [Caenorhabditis angaria]|uniref:Uncharacterized protein n=1 Tax=Caenorhabditis angaria TaxID=860376 RepID=A0A9P1IJN1_9PELO|nr:unnamed protein product [Caenorhabditis angaria]
MMNLERKLDKFELMELLCHSILHDIKIFIFYRLEYPDLNGIYQIGIWRFLGNQKFGYHEETEVFDGFIQLNLI